MGIGMADCVLVGCVNNCCWDAVYGRCSVDNGDHTQDGYNTYDRLNKLDWSLYLIRYTFGNLSTP